MVSKEFAEEVAVLLRGKLNGVDIQVQDVVKNNGIRLTGLVFQERGSLPAPCIYLEDFYAAYQDGGMDMGAAADEILTVYDRECKAPEFDVPAFLDYSRISSRLHGRLVNTEKNRGFLVHVPHREIFDLSLTYYVEVKGAGRMEGLGSIQVKDWHLKVWGVTEEEVYRQAMENLQADGRASVLNMADVLGGIPFPCAGQPEGAFSLYILTNRIKWNGAVQMLDKNALKEAAGMIGSDFYILPSSVHEVILVPAGEFCSSPESLAQMVREVNAAIVPKEDILSSRVYRYCTGSRQIQAAA